jgi:hypothetical protein
MVGATVEGGLDPLRRVFKFNKGRVLVVQRFFFCVVTRRGVDDYQRKYP